MIIVLEGAPAVGKTTVARELESLHGITRIAEVNELFAPRPEPVGKHWYYERQLDRIELSTKQSKSLLDGDPFQAIWFSWIYPDRGYPSWSEALDFFNRNETAITMPTKCVHLFVDESERYKREMKREAERGRSQEQFIGKWNRYSDFRAPQQALFEAIGSQFPGWVDFLESAELKQTARTIAASKPGDGPSWKHYSQFLADWLQRHSAEQFRQA